MKTVISILATIYTILFVFSCAPSSKDDMTKINIFCRECAGMEVFLTKVDILPTGPKELFQSKFDSLGQAKIQFTQNDTLSLLFVVKDRKPDEWKFYTTLYLEPGAGIDLTIVDGSPKFEGDLKIINSYFTKINIIEKERAKYANENLINRISASATKKSVFRDSLMQFGADLKRRINADKSISEHYRRMLVNYNLLFEITHQMHFDTQVAFIERSNNEMSVALDSTLSGAFKDLTLQRDFISNAFYISYLSNRLVPIFDDILNYRYENGVKTGEYEYIKGAIVKDKKLNDYQELLMALFIAHMSYDTRMHYELESKLIDLFQKDNPHSKYLTGLNYILKDYKELKSGMPMKDLEMQDINGKMFKLSSLKGNLVYIDVWATWCGPCVDELKYSVKLFKRYASNPSLTFLYVSLDEDKVKWKEFLNKNAQIKGLHGLQNSSFLTDSSIVTGLYKINGIPRYILIGKDGNIVNSNAKRPSELLSNNYLDSLLSL